MTTDMLFICEIEVIILFCRGSWIKVLIKEQKKQQVLKVKIIIWTYHFIVYLISRIIGVITIHCAVVRESLNTHPFLLDLSTLWVKFIFIIMCQLTHLNHQNKHRETHTPAHTRTIQEETHKEKCTHPIIGCLKPSLTPVSLISFSSHACGRTRYFTNWDTHQTDGSPCNLCRRAARSSGIARGRYGGLGWRLSTMGNSTTWTSRSWASPAETMSVKA